MSYKYFSQCNDGPGVTINSTAVACYYANPMQEESVILELVNGSKFELKTVLHDVEKWLDATGWDLPGLPIA